MVIPKTPMHFHIPIEIDPPEFRKWRKILNPITAPAAIERLEQMVEHYVTWFIDDIIEQGECDLRGDRRPLDRHGRLARSRRRRLEAYASAHHAVLAAVRGSAEWEQAVTVDLPYLESRTREVIAARRAEPADDTISYLTQCEVDGRVITDDEVYSIVDLLLAGGVGTTASLVSNTVVWLYQHQDVRRQLIDDPG